MADMMERNVIFSKIISSGLNRLFPMLGIFAGLGLLSILFGLLTGSGQAVWQSLLVNTLFFTGLVHGCLMFSAIITVTHARWGRPLKRMAEATVFFIPVGWMLFILLFFGMEHFFEWTDPDSIIPEKTWWLNQPFFIFRNLLLLTATGTAGIVYVLSSLKPDLVLFKEASPESVSELKRSDSPDWQFRFAALFAALFITTTCLIAFDWIMSLDQKWISTAFGFQYTTANLYGACAFLVIVFSLARKNETLRSYYTLERLNDLSRLLFVASLVWTYLVFSQILVIWYANLPQETPYLLLRMNHQPWSGMFIFLTLSLFLIPLFGLISKKACRSPLMTFCVAAVVLSGLWWEKYFLTIPSIQENQLHNTPLPGLNITPWDVTITIGIGATFLLCFLLFLRQFPALPISDPFLTKGRLKN